MNFPISIFENTMNPESRSLGRHRGANRLFGLVAGLLLLAGSSFDSSAATAEPPNYLTFQSYLTDDSETPIGSGGSVNRKVHFTIWTLDTGGAAKWSEEQIVTISDGHFSVILGQGAAISGLSHDLAAAFTGSDASDRYLEIKVSSDATTTPSESDKITPRLRLLTSPYAFRAREANKLVGTGGVNLISQEGTTTTVSGTASFTGGLTAKQTLNVDGNTTLGNASSDSVSVPGTLTVNTLLHVADAQVDGSATLGNAATDVVTINGPATAKNNLTVEGNTALGNAAGDEVNIIGDVNITGSFVNTSSTTLGSHDDTVTLGSTLNQSSYTSGIANSLKATDFTGAVTAGNTGNGTFSVDGTLTVKSTGTDGNNSFAANPVSVEIVGGSLDNLNNRVHMRFNDFSGDQWSFRSRSSTETTLDSFHIFSGGNSKVHLKRDTADWILGSDRRLKKDLEPVKHGVLDRLSEITTYRYRYNEQDDSEKKNIGVIAQEVRKVFPEVVSGKEGDNEFLGVSYGQLGPLAIAGINELRRDTNRDLADLRDKNAELEKENTALKEQFGDLLSRLQALEAKTK